MIVFGILGGFYINSNHIKSISAEIEKKYKEREVLIRRDLKKEIKDTRNEFRKIIAEIQTDVRNLNTNEKNYISLPGMYGNASQGLNKAVESNHAITEANTAHNSNMKALETLDKTMQDMIKAMNEKMLNQINSK